VIRREGPFGLGIVDFEFYIGRNPLEKKWLTFRVQSQSFRSMRDLKRGGAYQRGCMGLKSMPVTIALGYSLSPKLPSAQTAKKSSGKESPTQQNQWPRSLSRKSVSRSLEAKKRPSKQDPMCQNSQHEPVPVPISRTFWGLPPIGARKRLPPRFRRKRWWT
jgi:hypothetical protein